jgi:hypothetical protein
MPQSGGRLCLVKKHFFSLFVIGYAWHLESDFTIKQRIMSSVNGAKSTSSEYFRDFKSSDLLWDVRWLPLRRPHFRFGAGRKRHGFSRFLWIRGPPRVGVIYGNAVVSN